MCASRFSRKFLVPTLPSTILHREPLLQILEEALIPLDKQNMPTPYHLVLLSAPAGYGKTTLFADTVKRLSLACCWYFLDRSDTDYVTFLECLLTSIRQCFPGFGPHLDALLGEMMEQDQTCNYQRFLDVLIAALETDIAERYVLALCNYHEVNNCQAINDIVNQLLQRLPSQCVLVIESRALPNLELAALIAARKILTISSNRLRFSPQDLLALAQIQHMHGFSEEEAIRLASDFGGWITGILLGSHFGYTQFEDFTNVSGSWEIPAAATDHQQLFAFLVKDVFRDDQAIYHLLKDTSPLDQLTPAFCNILLGIYDAQERLEYAKRHGLFVMSTGEGEETVYVCHPVLRELFREELRRHDNERYRSLQRQIAILLHEAHEHEAALKYALEAQEYEMAATIMVEIVPALLQQGQNEKVRNWLGRLPAHLCQMNPRLLLLCVNTYLRHDDFANARILLEEAGVLAVPAHETYENGEHALVIAELTIARGKILVYQGEHQRALQQFQQALALLPIDECALRARVYQQVGICMMLCAGPLREVIQHFQQALQLCQSSVDEILAGELHHQLAIAYEWAGNSAIAEHHRRRVIAIQERFQQPRRVINNLTSMGRLKMYQGFVEEAKALFKNVLTMARDTPPLLSAEAYALLALGELELNERRFLQALTHLEEALALAHHLEDRYLLNCTLETLSLVYLRMDDIDTAQCYLGQMLLRMDETRSYEGILYTLAKGTLCLGQRRYDEAQGAFEQVIRVTEEAGMQRPLLQALMRHAVCLLEQGQRERMMALLRQIVALNKKGDHEYIKQIELQTYPALQPLLQEALAQEEEPASIQPQQPATTSTPSLEYLGIKVLPTARISIYALGEPTVLIDHTPITHWRMARAMELYFFLLESKQPLRKDQIITALWQEAEDIERINQTFRSTVYYLRQVIGEACIVQRSGLYRLDLRGEFWYDVSAFEEQQRIAKVALEEGDEEGAMQAFQNMVDLYRGDYVQPFYSDWCIWRRDGLRKALIDAHQQLALITWNREAWDESRLHWQHVLAIDPCMEAAHYGIMRCYIRQGKRDLALRQYQRCSAELYEQLKVKPGAALQKLYQRLTNSQL